jgi:hypothetical protein
MELAKAAVLTFTPHLLTYIIPEYGKNVKSMLPVHKADT